MGGTAPSRATLFTRIVGLQLYCVFFVERRRRSRKHACSWERASHASGSIPLLVPLQLRPQLASEVVVRVGVVPVLLPLLDILGVLFLGAPLCRSETFAGRGRSERGRDEANPTRSRGRTGSRSRRARELETHLRCQTPRTRRRTPGRRRRSSAAPSSPRSWRLRVCCAHEVTGAARLQG